MSAAAKMRMLAEVMDGDATATKVHVQPQDESSRERVRTLRPTSRGKIISQDERIRRVLALIDRVAPSNCTVLVTGESGTGKELVVAAIHDASPRRDAPLVTINCGAIPSELVESELFGHARGAFTGAQQARRGLVAAAEGGTLFFDEVGELPMPVQVKLLRLLQQREYTPVGETKAVKCDIRIVAATNRDLQAEVVAGRFREDLFYRLNVIHVELPALRQRPGDVGLLARYFCHLFSKRAQRNDLFGLSEAALAAIEAYPWPGNIRALENAIERGILLAEGPFVEAEDVLGSAPSSSVVSLVGPGAPSSVTGATTNIVVANEENESGVYRRFELPTEAIVTTPSIVSLRPPALPADDGPRRTTSDPNFPRTLPQTGMDLSRAAEQYQNNLIRQALMRTGGNRNQAARLLGLNRTTLVEMIRRRGI